MSDALESTLAAMMAELDAVLAEERNALMRFDAAAVEALTERKSALAERLGSVLEDASHQPAATRTKLLRMLGRIRWAAEANRALLAEASALLSSVRAMPSSNSGTYDRRSCVGRAAPGLARYGT